MIIDNTYFKGEIYIPHAKPSVVSVGDGVSDEIITFINEYEKEALLSCLGFQLYKQFVSNIDLNEPTLIKADADQKWDSLMNGLEYTNSRGKLVSWSGIRYKNPGSETYSSFLAYYVYFFYESQNYIIKTNSMSSVPKSKNGDTVVPNQAITLAWRKFYKMTQNDFCEPHYVENRWGLGIDYYRNNGQVGLYEFIENQNDLQKDTYENFQPKNWENLNQFGI